MGSLNNVVGPTVTSEKRCYVSNDGIINNVVGPTVTSERDTRTKSEF